MGNRKERRRYFSTVIKKAKTPAEYLQALLESPHEVHREEGKRLNRAYNTVIDRRKNEDTKEVHD